MKALSMTTLRTRVVAACATCLLALPLAACGQSASPANDALSQAVEQGSTATDEAASFDELVSERLEKGTIETAGSGLTPTSSNTKPGADGNAGVELTPQAAAPSKPVKKPWTVMIYIVGTNLESEGGQASSDINEMAAANVDSSKANVLYLTGGSYQWTKDIPNDRNVVWDLSSGEAVAISGANSMGDPATLSSFINFADAYYPAEHTALVFWDHGGGPILGFGEDELADGDGLLLPEMAVAMRQTPYDGSKKLDIVGFDACLMGSIEIANLWKDYANWMVGSEEVEAGIGWNWGCLAALNDEPTPAQFCDTIVNKFESAFKLVANIGGDFDYTLSALDLSVTSDVTAAVDNLAASLEYDVDAGDYSKINTARAGTTQFGVVNMGGSVTCFDLFDLGGFANQFSSTLPAEAGRVNEAVDRMVASHVSNMPETSGISIYFPASNQALWENAVAMMGTPMGEAYRTLTAAYAKRWQQGVDISWSLGELESVKALAEATLSSDGTEYLVPLEEEQVENLDYATYEVLFYQDDCYRRLLCDVRITPDDEGVLHVPVDPAVVALTSDELEAPLPLFAQQVFQPSRERYLCPSVKLFAEAEGESAADSVDVSLVLDKNDDGTLTLSSVPLTQGSAVVSRANANLADYQALSSLLGRGIAPTRDNEGDLLYHIQWDEVADSELAYQWTRLSDSVSFTQVPASELGLDVACQVVLVDQNGAAHATELFELAQGAEA